MAFANGSSIHASTAVNGATVTLGNVALGGVMTCSSGALAINSGSTLTVGSGGALYVAPSTALTLSTGTLALNGGAIGGGTASSLTLSGTSRLSATGGINTVSGAAVAASDVNISAAATFQRNGSSLMIGALTNSGTLQSSGAGTISVSGSGTYGGQFVADAGAGIQFTAGTQEFNGATFAGPGSISKTGAATLVVGAGGLSIGAGTAADLNSLALTGTGLLTNNGALTGNAFNWTGALTNGAGGMLSLTGGSVAGDFNNSGMFTVSGTVTLGGAVADQLGGQIVIPAGAVLSRTTGALRWINGVVGGDGFGTGSLSFSSGGNFAFSGTGDRVIDGLNFSFSNLTLPNGSLTLQSGSLTLTGSTVLPSGVALNLNGGTLTNNSAMDIGGTFDLGGGTFNGSGNLSMTGGSLTLPSTSTVTWSNTGALANTGTLNLAGGTTITNAITNSGTINAGAVTFSQTFTNNGTLIFGSATTTFTGGLVQNTGQIQLNGGTVGGDVTLNAGTLAGSGTVGGALNVNNATLAPGYSPGAITVTGDLNLVSTSTLTIELGGTAQGSGYDFVNVLGTANLAGTLNVSPFGGYVAGAGSNFTFMNFASTTGSFATVNLPSGWNLSYITGVSNLSLLAPTVASASASVSSLASLVAAQTLTAESVALMLERVDDTGDVFSSLISPGQILVSVEKPIAEEACQ